MLTPKDYIGPLMELAQDRRGEFKEMKYIAENRASITYELPLAEVSIHNNAINLVIYKLIPMGWHNQFLRQSFCVCCADGW